MGLNCRGAYLNLSYSAAAAANLHPLLLHPLLLHPVQFNIYINVHCVDEITFFLI